MGGPEMFSDDLSASGLFQRAKEAIQQPEVELPEEERQDKERERHQEAAAAAAAVPGEGPGRSHRCGRSRLQRRQVTLPSAVTGAPGASACIGGAPGVRGQR